MGMNSNQRSVVLFLEALERILRREAKKIKPGAGVSATMEAYS